MFLTPLLMTGLWAFQVLPPVSAASDFAHLNKNINPPKLRHTFEPAYTPQARAAGIEGSVVLQVIVDKQGHVSNASVISPLPAGLDREALTAIKHWQYEPATMDGELVPIVMTVDVRFKLPYNSSQRKSPPDLSNLNEGTPSPSEMDEVKRLANENSPQALFLLARWTLAKDPDNSWKLMRRAAYFGNATAQQMLADKANREGDHNAAQWYYRLCAATAHPVCEYRLGKLLVSGSQVNPNDFAQGVAWLELAKDHGYQPAMTFYQTSAAKLSSVQIDWVDQLKPQLELRKYQGF